MKKTFTIILAMLMLSIFFNCLNRDAREIGASDASLVINRSTGLSYQSIQAAIDAPQTVDGNVILVKKGTYSGNVTIRKSISLVGEDRRDTIIDGNGAKIVVLVAANNVTVKNFLVRNGFSGIFVSHSNKTRIVGNSVVSCIPDTSDNLYQQAIRIEYSFYCTIQNNTVANNAVTGILVTDSSNFTVSGNQVYRNGLSSSSYGLNTNSSYYGLISYNNVFENGWDGIGLGNGSRYCIVMGNNLTNNKLNIWVDHGSDDNVIYGNNMIKSGSGLQTAVANAVCQWDSGAEGNYWNDYVGADMNNDGISDTQKQIDANNTDRYPLMGPFSSFVAYKDQSVGLVSNSKIDDITFFKTNATIRMHVSSSVEGQSSGFCRVNVPHTLMIEPYNVTVDGAEPSYVNYTLKDDGNSRWIYFAYPLSAHEVSVQGASPPDTLPPIVSVISPESMMYTNSSVPLNFTVDEETSWIGYSLDGKANVTITGNMTLSELLDGTHDLAVYANDTSGNMGFSDTVHFTISTQQGWPFLVWVAVGTVVAVIVGVGVGVYLRKTGKPIKKGR